MKVMFRTALLLFGLAGILAVVDWRSVARRDPVIENVAKPSVMVALCAAVVFAGEAPLRWLVVVGLLLSLVGDVLLLEAIDRFLGGLGAFFAAHVFYAIAFSIGAANGFDQGLRLVGVIVSVALAGAVGIRVIDAARSLNPRLGGAVAAYIGVLAIMIITGWATGSALAAIGVTVFALSDALLGWNRFIAPLPNGRLATHVLYHLGQGFIAGWAIGL